MSELLAERERRVTESCRRLLPRRGGHVPGALRVALLGAIERIAPLPLAGAVLLLAAGFVGDWLRWVLWLGAIAIGLFGPLFTGLEGWPLHIAHFVERHGLASQVVCRTWCAGTNDQTPKGATWVPKLVM